jgi:tight adherence protein B
MLQADVFVNPGAFERVGFLVSSGGFWPGILVPGKFSYRHIIALGIGNPAFPLSTLEKKGKSLKFERQMPDAMEILARSLRAGHTLPSAIELLGEEMGAHGH